MEMRARAGEWQQRKGGVVTPDGVFWSEQATDGGGGGRKRMRAVRPDDALYQPVTAHPGRIKTTAENHNILTSYEHSFTDKTKFECLRQAELWREDPTHNGRYQRLQSVQPTAEASQRSTRNAAQGPRPDSRRGPWIKITEPEKVRLCWPRGLCTSLTLSGGLLDCLSPCRCRWLRLRCILFALFGLFRGPFTLGHRRVCILCNTVLYWRLEHAS